MEIEANRINDKETKRYDNCKKNIVYLKKNETESKL